MNQFPNIKCEKVIDEMKHHYLPGEEQISLHNKIYALNLKTQAE